MPDFIDRVTVIAVGVENYEHLDVLSGPSADVANLRTLLVEDSATALYAQKQFVQLIDPDSAELRRVLNDYVMSRSASGDILLFYFSGHGVPIGQNDFGFCTCDSVVHPTEEMILPLSVLRFTDLLETLVVRGITPVIIIDACYSGIAGRSMVLSSNELIPNMRREVQKENASNYGLLCACGSNQTVPDTPEGGIFSQYLVEAAQEGLGGTYRRQHRLSLRDLYPKLQQQIEAFAEDWSPRLYLGDTLPAFALVKNTQYSAQSYSLDGHLLCIVEALWNGGEEVELTPREIDERCGKGAYGNHNKLSYGPWQLVEWVSGTSPKRRRLTARGRAFIQGQLAVPKRIVRVAGSDEFVEDGTEYIRVTLPTG